MNRIESKYSRDDRKSIVESIESLKNDKDYVAIFEILTDDPAGLYTQNSNGVFLNLTSINDGTLDKITKYLKKINRKKVNESEIDVDIIPNTGAAKNDRTYKLSNYEKNILKHRKLKQVLNDDDEYEELKFVEADKKVCKKGKKKASVCKNYV